MVQIKKIEHKGVLLAKLISGEWEQGLSFYSEPNDFIQAGSWRYAKGKELLPHVHNAVERKIDRTQEVLFVKKGRVRVKIFDLEDKPLAEHELRAGDIGIFLRGGHGYTVLEDDTQVLEVKNGPYPGPDADRRRL
ncbi:Uncharacterised protein [Candidatus Burarchaeum australiense]|nr:Uncharacterised protein [Candidatus Burarchaeum australiense]